MDLKGTIIKKDFFLKFSTDLCPGQAPRKLKKNFFLKLTNSSEFGIFFGENGFQ